MFRGLPVAVQVTSRLTVAATSDAPRNWKLSTIGRSTRWSRAVLPCTTNASSGMRTVQNSPEGAMPALKSWSCEPEPGSNRSTHTKPKVPRWRVPSADT